MVIREPIQRTAEALDRLYAAGAYGDTRVEVINGGVIEVPSNRAAFCTGCRFYLLWFTSNAICE